MPKSRGRKKNKKKKSSKNQKFKKKQVFENNGLEITRLGKKVLFKNNRTPEEHAKYIEKVKKDRPKQFEKLQDKIEKAIKLFQDYDNLKLLGGLCYNHTNNQLNPEDDGLSETTLELGLSYATALSDNPSKEPSPEIINQLIELLANIRFDYNSYIMSESVTGSTQRLKEALD